MGNKPQKAYYCNDRSLITSAQLIFKPSVKDFSVETCRFSLPSTCPLCRWGGLQRSPYSLPWWLKP